MTVKIYYIEDDESIADEVRIYLNKKGYDVLVIGSISEAKNKLNREVPLLCLVDWNLPDGTGENLCGWIREKYAELPIIFITVKDQINEIVNGFQIGADDYITKPFDLEILYSRIGALLRRAGTTTALLTCGKITVDKSKYKVMVDCEEVLLSSMEYQLLLLLLENKNRIVTRQRLLELIWDANGNYVNDNTLTVTMKRLREKLNNPDCVKTIRSFGYRMEDL
ncbi:MAG: response regulator transcription factor [Lachnospiraceae bacterium]